VTTQRERRFIEELAQAAKSLFERGTSTPDAEAIAAAHFQDRLFGGAAVEDVRKKLIRIRDILAEDYQLPVTLVSRVYYSRFRKAEPTSLASARLCLALGYGKKAEGIHMQTGPDDLIWQAANDHNLAAAAGKWKRAADRTVDAYDNGRITKRTAAEVLFAGRRRMQSDQPSLLAELENPELVAEIELERLAEIERADRAEIESGEVVEAEVVDVS
jgi:hypothetical protein